MMPLQLGQIGRDRVVATFVVAVLLIAYCVTLMPGPGGAGDTAKFQLLSAVLGTPHATGYPAYLLLEHLFNAVVPFGSPALRANLLSAVLAALACGVVFMTLRVLGTRPSAAFAASLCLGLGATLWSQALAAEVYTLHTLLVALIILFALRWQRSRRTRDLLLAWCALAVGLGNHVTVVVMVPALLTLIGLVDRYVLLRPRAVVGATAAVLCSLLLYGYLVWKTFDPEVRYLEVAAGDLRELVRILLGGRHRDNLFQLSLSGLMTGRVPLMLGTIVKEYSVLLVAVLVGMLRRLEARDWFLAVAAAGNLAFIASYTVQDLFVYFLPVYVILAVYLGLGLDRLVKGLRLSGWRAVGALSVLPIVLGACNCKRVDQSANGQGERALALLGAAPSPAVIISLNYDLVMRLHYFALLGPARAREQKPLHLHWRTTQVSFGLEEIYRYLNDGAGFRMPPRGRLVEPGMPVVVVETSEQQRRDLRYKGFRLEELAPGAHRLFAQERGSPPLPLALVVRNLESCRTVDDAVAVFYRPDFDPTRTAVVLGPSSVQSLPRPTRPDVVRVERWTDDEARVKVDIDTPGWLVLTDSFPSFWEAWVDREPVASEAANVIHRLVFVEAGRHEVVLRDAAVDFTLWRWVSSRRASLP